MRSFILISFAFVSVGISAISKADYNSYYDCKKEWNVCVVPIEETVTSSYIYIIQMHNEQTTLDKKLHIKVTLDGKAFLVTDKASIEIGDLGEKNETANELRLRPDFNIIMNSRKGPDSIFCGPVEGPMGKVLFQRDYVHTKLFQIQIFLQQSMIVEWASLKPQAVYPAYKSRVSTKPCL